MQGADEVAHKGIRLFAAESDPVLDGDWHRHRVLHRLHAVGDQRRLTHQTGAERTALHAFARAAAVEVDLVIAVLLADACAARQIIGLAAAKLQGHRLLARIKTEQPLPVTVQNGAGRHHLGIEPGMTRQLSVKEAAMPVGPVHHRCHAEHPRQTARQYRRIRGNRVQIRPETILIVSASRVALKKNASTQCTRPTRRMVRLLSPTSAVWADVPMIAAK